MPAPLRSASARSPWPIASWPAAGCRTRSFLPSARRPGMRTEPRLAKRTRGYRWLLSYAVPYTRGWLGIAAAMLLSTAVSLLQPWPLKVLVDQVLGGAPAAGALQAVIF